MNENQMPRGRTLAEILNLKIEEISLRPDIMRMRPASVAEFEALRGDVDVDGPVKGKLVDWHLVSQDIREQYKLSVLIGYLEPNRTTLRTSPIAAIDLERGFVRTQNSIYAIGDRGSGDVPTDLCWLLCYSLFPSDVKMGGILGIPEIFY